MFMLWNSGYMTQADITPNRAARRKKMSKGKPKPGGTKDMRLKSNRKLKGKRRGGRRKKK